MVKVEHEYFTVEGILEQVKKFTWNKSKNDCPKWDKRSKELFINSLFQDYPMPPIFVAEELEGKIIILDGVRRIDTMLQYLNDELEIDNQVFSDLSDDLQDYFKNRKLQFTVVKSEINIAELTQIISRRPYSIRI